MNILLANKYFFIKGGADNSFFATADMLQQHGHNVRFFSMEDEQNFPTEFAGYFVSNVNYENPSVYGRAKAAGRLLYSFEARKNLSRLLNDYPVDIAHLNSIYHQISPSIVDTLAERGIPSVMTLRDYKIVCASYLMLDKVGICEACKGNKYYNIFRRRCVKNSGAKSLLNMAEMYLHHSMLNLYSKVGIFIAPSLFLRDKVREMGFVADVRYLPNFADISRFKPSYEWKSKEIVYFGRLSWEKGLVTLIRAAKGLPLSVKLIGDGAFKKQLEDLCKKEDIKNVTFTGFLRGEELQRAVSNATCVVSPSEWYENNPRTVIEGFALGKPVIGARIGGIPELVRDGETGWTFASGSVDGLRACLKMVMEDPESVKEMGKRARMLVETELSPTRHYERLSEIYGDALAGRTR